MSEQTEQHDLVRAVKDLALELGRTPTKAEFCSKIQGAHYKIAKFGNYSTLLQAAGIATYDERRSSGKRPIGARQKDIRSYQKLCSRKEQIHGHFRHVIDLEDLFQRAGNPPTLKVSVQPDTHAKFVDVPAFRSYLKFLRAFQPHGHVILGDFADCEGLSHWPADDLEPRRIVPEMKQSRELLQKLVDATPNAVFRIFCEGNHENWISQAFTRMPELFEGLAELDIEISVSSLLGLKKFGYELFPLNHLVQIGKAHFTHGLYTSSNHAAKHLNQLKANVYYGHLHDTQEHNSTSMDGPLEAASLGCLCKLDAKFLKGRPNNWVHSHGVFEFFPDGSYTFYKPKIINGRMSYNGIVFDGNEP